MFTGKAENIQPIDRGIQFTVVVKDDNGKEVLRRMQWVSTGIWAADDIPDVIKNVVQRFTEDMWAHVKGAEVAITKKDEIEAHVASCDRFIDTRERTPRKKIHPSVPLGQENPGE